ncbi:MAG: hypothetical protein CMC89_05190 [Flavobacteriaceae bacterium]|nr:hypothetical protein [Flavobacteriaceae bacterium]|tara:strand:- start:472 stop:735 length:264 start_codon:yes stop_codon:yes gene_type:complete
MNWVIVAVMSMIHMNDMRDVYVFTQPTFDTSKQCIEYVQQNGQGIAYKLTQVYPNDRIAQVLCIPKKGVADILEKSSPVNPQKGLDI